MADPTTTYYNLVQPTPGADTNVWGPLLNTNFVTIDKLLAIPQPARHAGTLVVSTVTLDLSASTIWTYTVVGATTFAFSNVPTGTFASEVWLLLTNGGAGALTWPGSVTWLTGVAPTLKASGVDILRFQTPDNGTTWYGSRLSPYTPVQTLFQAQGLTTSSTSEVSLTTYSLPASTLAVNGQSLEIDITGVMTAGATTGMIRVKFGATYILNSGGTGNLAQNTVFRAKASLVRTGATTQLGNGIVWAGTAITTNDQPAPTETLSGAVTVDIRGSAATGGASLHVDMVTIKLVTT